MYCVKNIKDDLFWVGGSDRRLALFENAYPIPNGISYNSYLLLDEKTVLFDTVDRAVFRKCGIRSGRKNAGLCDH